MTAPILPTVELPDRVHSWSYDLGFSPYAGRGWGGDEYVFRWYVDDCGYSAGITPQGVEWFTQSVGWQAFWDAKFADSVARTDEVPR